MKTLLKHRFCSQSTLQGLFFLVFSYTTASWFLSAWTNPELGSALKKTRLGEVVGADLVELGHKLRAIEDVAIYITFNCGSDATSERPSIALAFFASLR